MKKTLLSTVIASVLAATVLIGAPSGVSAQDTAFTRGNVKEMDVDAGKVTIIHEALVNLDMPAMTMVFRASAEILGELSKGQDIEFVADRVQGKLTVVELR